MYIDIMLGVKSDMSIIIPVYNRTEYVNSAIKSILGLNSNTYQIEILIISNIDLLIEVNNESIRLIKTNLKSLSKKIEIGVKESSSDIIAFLEDDDLWCNNKINKIFSVLKDNKNIDFYHNEGLQFKNSINYKNVHIKEVKETNNIIYKKDFYNNNSNKLIRLIIKNSLGYNLSSIAVRKNLIINHLDILNSLSVNGIDNLLLIIALIYGNGIYEDKNIRTFIRIHANNSYKHSNDLIKPIKKINSDIPAINKFIKLNYLSTNIIVYCRDIKSKKSIIFKMTLKYIKYCLELGIMPPLYILVESFSRIINVNLYYFILNIYHS